MKRIRKLARDLKTVPVIGAGQLDQISNIILALVGVAEKADKFDERLTYVEGHPNYKSVWAINQAHCGPYQGPTYTKEIEWLRSALTALDEKVGEILG